MASRRDGILAAITMTLGSATVGGFTKPSGLVVTRFRSRPTTSTTAASTAIYPVAQTSQRVGQNRSPLTQHRLTARLEHRVAVPAGSAADQVLDPLLLWAVRSLFADETLGGLVSAIEETACQWDAEEADVTYAVAWQDVTVTFAALANDPSARS